MIKMIAAVSKNMVIGKDNQIPWHYKEDLKHFKNMTINNTVIMGRNTFESMGSKPLTNRRNIVITSRVIDGVECYDNLKLALQKSENIWLIGGRSIYEEGMKYADEIHLTVIPENIKGEGLIKFPDIDSSFKIRNLEKISDYLYKEVYCR